LCVEILLFYILIINTQRAVALNPRQQLNKQWRKTMADRLTDAFGNKALVERLTEMSREAPELTLSEAIKNIQEDLADKAIIDDNGC
jgi:hypothetical protein